MKFGRGYRWIRLHVSVHALHNVLAQVAKGYRRGSMPFVEHAEGALTVCMLLALILDNAVIGVPARQEDVFERIFAGHP
jgi:hypothetical protein